MPAKHICLLHTGGTIGMEKTAHGYAPMKDFTAVLSSLLSRHDGLPQYTLHAFANPIDSTNATPEEWSRIGNEIAARYYDYDGFVVLHGTDTMAYTAAALSFMLQGLRKPVVLTGSQIPLGEPRSDGLQNLMGALQCAGSDELNEVVIYFGQRLLRGNRATKVSAQRFDAFDSPNFPPLAEIEIEIRMHSLLLLPRADNEHFQLPSYSSGEILTIRMVPGLPARAVQAVLDLNPRAVILQGYGTGNVPDRDPALTQALVAASDRGIVLVGCSQSLHAQVQLGTYATGAALARAQVIAAMDMTFEAIFAKLHHLFALGLNTEEVRAALTHNLSGELTS